MGSSGPRGLTPDEAARRLAEVGPNTLSQDRSTPWWITLGRQFASPLIALLVVAGVVAGLMGEAANAIAIAAIVVLNGLIGFVQEYRAERAVLALRALSSPRARVRRDGHTRLIAAEEVVPGDLLVLEAGDVVSADGTLLEAHALEVDEAALTGESLPAGKRPGPTPDDAPLAEQEGRVFSGTSVVRGTGLAEVSATGMSTELGRIADLLDTAEDTSTPLQRRLAGVGRTLLWICLALVVLVGALGWLRGLPPLEVVLSSISLAVAAVPEGLPAVVTIALAVGVQRMAEHHVLVRSLPAVETLGSVTTICTDKTGTLTRGEMVVREVWADDEAAALSVAVACADADLSTRTGDPTELALLAGAAERHDLHREPVERANPRVSVHPFDTERKRMSILREDGVLYVKGAPDRVIPLCTGGTEGAEEANHRLAAEGLRVLAMATGDHDAEEDLTLVGLVGLADPPKEGAAEAVRRARAAGIRPVMITGDQRVTAEAIAREIGLLAPGDDPATTVHARVTPEDKLTLVRETKARGEVVAMTGDGVNDAPALREAHIGIAMGIKGTEVTREAADMVLTDDDFASIVEGIRQGRAIYDNIRKTLVYLLAGNAGELLVMLGAAVVALPLPLLPVQILWINLITDGLPALALVVDPADPDVLGRPPREPDTAMLDRPAALRILVSGALQATVALSVFTWALGPGALEVSAARSLAFTTLVFGELFRAFAARSERRTFFEVGALTNLRLLAVIGVSALLQLALLFVPALQHLFELAPLTLSQLGLAVGLGLVPVTALELYKILSRGFLRAPTSP